MGKKFTYHLRLEREDAVCVMKTWYDEGLSRSAILRMAIDDIPVKPVVERLAGMRVGRGEPSEMDKIPFSIHLDQRTKLDTLIASNVEAAFVVRHSLRRYLDKSVDDLKLVSGTMRAPGKQRKEIERAKLRDRLSLHDAVDPKGALARIAEARKGHIPSQSTPIPIRAPAVDWSQAGPVKPRRATPEAQEAARKMETSQGQAPATGQPGTLQAAMAGLEIPKLETVAEPHAEPATAPKLSPLDVLRKKQGK